MKWIIGIVFGCLLIAAPVAAGDKAELKVLMTRYYQNLWETSPALFSVGLRLILAVDENDHQTIGKVCPRVPEIRKMLNEERKKLDDAVMLKGLDQQQRQLIQALEKEDCFYAPGYALYSRMDNFCGQIKDGGMPDPEFARIYRVKFIRYYMKGYHGKEPCQAIIDRF